MKALAAFFATVLAVLLCACGGQSSMLPKSGGRPYEVLVVSGGGDAGRMLDSILSRDAEGLPQSEPMFDVSLTDSLRFNQAARLARNIVIVTVNPGLFTSLRIKYEKNVWARPQMVAYVNAPSAVCIRDGLPRLGRSLADLFTRAEMNAEIARLSVSGNARAEAVAKDLLDCEIRIPSGMKYSKTGDGFAWFSNNAARGMQNICVYSYPGLVLDPELALAARDSVMMRGIPGERTGMYMRTVPGSVRCGLAKEKGRTLMISRGLWEMRGDAMGGPFVAHSMVDSARGRVVVAEAFVYAPESRKRNLIRQSEAALYTLRIKD